MHAARWICVATLALALPAGAHVGASPDENNRYLKLIPLGDAIRFVYTVYFGDRPGHTLRGRLDLDGDRVISDAEARRFGDELGVEIAAGLTLEVDHHVVPVAWREIDVGLGDAGTAGGSFAVDLVSWLCFESATGRTRHSLVLRDRFALPTAGESELRVEESPGVRILHASLGGGPRDLDLRWRGPEPATAGPGYQVEIDVDPAVATASGACGRGAGPVAAAPSRRWPLIGATAVALALAGAAVILRRRRASRPGST